MPKPADAPEPFWKAEDDWYEFFDFTCPSCGKAYTADYGSDMPSRYAPRPMAVRARWDPRQAPVRYQAVVTCPCLVRFDVAGGGAWNDEQALFPTDEHGRPTRDPLLLPTEPPLPLPSEEGPPEGTPSEDPADRSPETPTATS